MTLKLNGSTDGSVSIDAPADTSPTGTDITLTLPTTVGSANQFVKNGGTAGELEYSSMVEDSTGDVQARRARSNTAGDVALSVQPSDSSIHYGLRIDASNNNLNLDKVSGTAANLLTIDSSGRLGLGTTSPGSFDSSADNFVISSNTHTGLTIDATPTTSSSIHFADGTTGNEAYRGIIEYRHNDDMFVFRTSATERMRIGNNGETTLRPATYGLGVRSVAGSSSVNTAYFGAHSSTSMGAGTITFEVYTNGNVKNTNNSYGQLSDERLKENIINAPSQWDDIKSLQIRKYNFRDGNGYDTHTQIGLVAQEVQTVCPGLVQETPVREDATPVLDAEGNELEATKSVLTSVLYMKAVKALQEAQTRIETLETQHADLLARVTALEAAE